MPLGSAVRRGSSCCPGRSRPDPTVCCRRSSHRRQPEAPAPRVLAPRAPSTSLSADAASRGRPTAPRGPTLRVCLAPPHHRTGAGIPGNVRMKGAGPRLGGNRGPAGRVVRGALSDWPPPRLSHGGPRFLSAGHVSKRRRPPWPPRLPGNRLLARSSQPRCQCGQTPARSARPGRDDIPAARRDRPSGRLAVAALVSPLGIVGSSLCTRVSSRTGRAIPAGWSRAGRPSARCRRRRPSALAVAPSPRVQCRRLRAYRIARLAALHGRPRRAYRGRVRDEPVVTTTRCECRTPSRQSVPAAATRPVLRADDQPALRLALALERVTSASLGFDSSRYVRPKRRTSSSTLWREWVDGGPLSSVMAYRAPSDAR